MRVRWPLAGALGGVAATVVFTVVHALLINPIWFALPAMLVAGAVCGLCIAWSYRRVVEVPSRRSWWLYNLQYLVMFVLLGLVSLVVFDPVTTIPALLAAREPPRELIARALPMTGGFTLGAAALLSLRYRTGVRGAVSLFTTTVALVVLLGLNISTLGLVEVPTSAAGILGETLTLLVILGGAYAVMVPVLAGRDRQTGA